MEKFYFLLFLVSKDEAILKGGFEEKFLLGDFRKHPSGGVSSERFQRALYISERNRGNARKTITKVLNKYFKKSTWTHSTFRFLKNRKRPNFCEFLFILFSSGFDLPKNKKHQRSFLKWRLFWKILENSLQFSDHTENPFRGKCLRLTFFNFRDF